MIKQNKTKSVPTTKQMVWDAYKKVKRKRGSAGVDGEDFNSFEETLPKNLYKIWNRLASGSYFPPAVKEVEIPKKSGGLRSLGIPTISDRVAQTVVKDYLEKRFEALFHDQSYGYRPLKSAHQAVEQVRQNCRTKAWVIDLDIKGFFDNIDHELLLKAIDCHVDESWVKMYIARWLEAPVNKANGQIVKKEGKGTPQGGVISPQLANLFMHYAFDMWIEINHPKTPFVRYADDVIVHCATEEEAKSILQSIHQRMNECKLELHPQKTKIVYCKDYRRRQKSKNNKFDFLGFSFQPRPTRSKRNGKMFLGFNPAISKGSGKEIIAEFRKLQVHRWTAATIETIAEALNPKIRGWINYYGKFRRSELRFIFRSLRERLMKWLINKHKSLKGSKTRGYDLLTKHYEKNPKLFYHWEVGYSPK
jgi:RNA-directed DNA polymerase